MVSLMYFVNSWMDTLTNSSVQVADKFVHLLMVVPNASLVHTHAKVVCMHSINELYSQWLSVTRHGTPQGSVLQL